jgi:diguanylate cyclase
MTGPKTKILIIEDTASLRDDLIEILECLDFEVIEAANGKIGLQMAQKHLPDLIISDIMMPELDGYGVFAGLKNNPETASIPFIFLTAKADKSDFRKGMNLGADDYLIKPFTIDELKEAVNVRLQKKQFLAEHYAKKSAPITDYLNHLSLSDILTNLPNRLFLTQELPKIIKDAETSHKLIGVFILDVDKFQSINTIKGQKGADLVLQEISQRLLGLTKENNGIVARTGGDEFAIIFPNMKNSKTSANFSQSLLNLLSNNAYRISGDPLRIKVSVGMTIYPKDAEQPDQLLNNAYTALQWAKQKGGNNYQFYDLEKDLQSVERKVLEKDLHTALEKQQFQVYYQPQVELSTGNIVGAECLIRWKHPDMGFISPMKFIPIAEETGLIIPIGEWVLRQGCKQAKIWQKYQPLRIAVNLSAMQFQQENLVEKITQVIKETQLNAHCLELEITETSAMANVEQAITTLYELQSMGIHLAIDDFGTGHCSLNYLRRFPIDTLKIDKSFITDITQNELEAEIVIMIIRIAKILNLQVVAEGVETIDELNFVRTNGCYSIQGYYFSPPLPADRFESLLMDKENSFK